MGREEGERVRGLEGERAKDRGQRTEDGERRRSEIRSQMSEGKRQRVRGLEEQKSREKRTETGDERLVCPVCGLEYVNTDLGNVSRKGAKAQKR